MTLKYNTRDAKGNNFTKDIALKTYEAIDIEFICQVCGIKCSRGVPTKKIVSSNFTDWTFVVDYICRNCSKFFGLYFYSYIVNGDNIRLLNIREMAKEILLPQVPPFKIVISTSQKKHLFYKAVFNDNPDSFVANLEEEQIACDLDKLREQMWFVSSLQALGQSKNQMQAGDLSFDVLIALKDHDLHRVAIDYLRCALQDRQIQIPLYLSQKAEVTKREALDIIGQLLRKSGVVH